MQLWLVTADRKLFDAVCGWAYGTLSHIPAPEEFVRSARMLLITTPAPWRSIVAIAEQHGDVLQPVIVVKNAVALWSMKEPPLEGLLSSETWFRLRQRFLIHNPGLAGLLEHLDQRIEHGEPD